MIITVFDFDDTIFATSHFFGKDKFECVELSNSINQILEIASKYGHVFIITNAEKKWVNKCVEKYLPGCHILSKYIGCIFSTIDNGLTKDNHVSIWKTIAFQKKLELYFQDAYRHDLICFGDNPYDRIAALNIKEKYKNVVVKNTLMIENPSLDHLLQQHKIIIKVFESLSSYEGHLDLLMSVSSLSTIQKSSEETGDEFDR
jgi:hypothetical protein